MSPQSSFSQKSPNNSKKHHLLINGMSQNQKASNQLKNFVNADGKLTFQQASSLNKNAILNSSNRSSGINKQKEAALPTTAGDIRKKEKSSFFLVVKDLTIIMFSLPAVIMMYEIFLSSEETTEESNQVPKFWIGVLSYISLKLIAGRIKIPIMQVSYVVCGFSYFMIKYWIKYGFKTDVVCITFILLCQQITQQMAFIFEKKVHSFYKKYSKYHNLFDILRITIENGLPSDGIGIRKSDFEEEFTNRLLKMQSQQHKRDNETPRVYSPRRDQSIQFIQQNSIQNKSQPMIPQISEYQISRGTFFERNQSPMQLMSQTNNQLKRSTTFNQKINELKMGGFYSQLFGLIPVGVAIISNSKNLLYASSQMLQMLNCQDEQKALKILLNLNTNAQKSTQFGFDEESDSEEDDNFYGPPDFIANFASSVNTYNHPNPQNGPNNNNNNVSEKASSKAKREGGETNTQSRSSPQILQKPMNGYQQHNQSFKENSMAPSGFVEEERSSRYMIDDDEDNYRTRRISSTVYNNYGNNNNSHSHHVFIKPSINHSQYPQQNFAKDSQQMIFTGLIDFKSPQHSVNGSMMDIGTERNNLLNLNPTNNDKSPVPSTSLLAGYTTNSQQQLGNISSRRMQRKSTNNFSSRDLKDDRWVSEENNMTHMQQQSQNFQRDSNNQIPQQQSQLSQGRLSYTNIPLKHLQQIQMQHFQDTMGESERQIIEEEELGVNGSIINPELQLNELQFQRPEYSKVTLSPKNGMESAGLKKRGSGSLRNNLRQMSAMKSVQDNGSDNKTEAQQREESVMNILNMMLGWSDIPQRANSNQYTNNPLSSAKIKSQKKIINSYNYQTSNSGDPDNFNSPQPTTGVTHQHQSIYAKGQQQFQNQSTQATQSQNQIQQKQYQQQELTQATNELITNSLAKQLEVNREKQSSCFKTHANSHGNVAQNEIDICNQQDDSNTQEPTNTKSLGLTNNNTNIPPNSATNQNSSKKKPQEENKKDFDEMLKQKQKLGYIQQEGNVSTMQIEYLGEQYILKIIIHSVLVGSSGEMQKVAIIVMERMWQDFMIKKVEDLIKQKMQLFGSLSHELRTPLNCSISMLEVLHNISQTDPRLQNQLTSYVQPALNSNKLLLNMINDILDFVQLENGSFKFGLVEFDLQNLLKECVSLVQIQAKMKNLTIACYYDPQTPKIIKSDPNRIRQVILNFLSNALKFTIAGHIIVYASAHNGTQEVTIGVKDTGIGINQENTNEIFKVFNKIDLGNHQKLNLQGCGVGLALSNSIAKALGPKDTQGIQVQSQKDQGSTFSFVVQNQNPPITDKEEDIYENDDVSNDKLLANFSIIRPKVTQIKKDNQPVKSKKHKRRHSFSSQHSNQHTLYNRGSIHQKLSHNTQGTNQVNNSIANSNNANSNNTPIHNTISYNNTNTMNTMTKLGFVDGMNVSSDNSISFNIPDPTYKNRSISLTQISQSQRKNIINSYNGSIQEQQQSPNDRQIKSRGQKHFHYQHTSTIGHPQSPTRQTSQNGYPSFMSALNVNPTEKKQSLLETIKSKDFQDMHLLDHSKYDSPAGFNSYHDDGDQGIIKRSLESIQNNILQFGCQCSQILIVDDQEFNLYSLTQLLKQFYGIISDTAVNSAQVMQKIQAKLHSDCCKTYRIVFMDINMPQKNGYEVAREIKQFYAANEFLKSIMPTIIACSAYNGEEDKKKAHSNGMVDFVTKPIMKAALDVIISKYYDSTNLIPQQLLNI